MNLRSQPAAVGAVPERCANPSCGAHFDLRQGKLFQFEIRSVAIEPAQKPRGEAAAREMARFWLCGRCSAAMTLVLTPHAGILLQSADSEQSELLSDA